MEETTRDTLVIAADTAPGGEGHRANSTDSTGDDRSQTQQHSAVYRSASPLGEDHEPEYNNSGIHKSYSTQGIATYAHINENADAPEPSSRKRILAAVWIFISCFFVTVASVLGTGILALPVKVGQSGFSPFLVTFSVCLVMQSFIILFMIELLQRTQRIQEHLGIDPAQSQASKPDSDGELVIAPEQLRSYENIDLLTGADTTGTKATKSAKLLAKGPDLHVMGTIFLGRIPRLIFEIAVVQHFISILISYALAGPQAYAGLLHLDYRFFISPFVIILTLFVIFGYRYVTGIISIFTLLKGALLLVMVGIGGGLAFVINENFHDDFIHIGKPFLIGTVALGGAINTLPVIYGKMKPTKLNIHVFQVAAVSGIVVCFALNVLWCLFILMIVPQTSTDPNEPTLEKALKEQQISTVILVDVLQKNYPQFTWISYVVSVFIMVSVTVSFVTLSTGFKHMLDGYVKSFINSMNKDKSLLNRIVNHPYVRWTRRPELVFQGTLYFVCWFSILVVAQLNPQSIFYVMEVFTSMSLNLEAGLFVSWMMASACWGKFSHLNILAPLPRVVQWFFIVVALYFIFAVGYDIVIVTIDLVVWVYGLLRPLF